MRKYPTLRIIAICWRVLAFLILVLGVIGSIAAGAELAYYVGVPEAVLVVSGIVLTLLLIIPLLASAELIYLFIDVEQNTRSTSELLNKGGE